MSSLTQPVWHQPVQVVRNPDGTTHGKEPAEEPVSQTPSSDAKPEGVGFLSDRWMGLRT